MADPKDKQGTEGSQPEVEFSPGTAIGRYRVEEPVGQGGMGTVYRVFDASTNRYVAMKILAPDLSETLRDRFLAECEAQARIRHEHVMPVYDQGWLTDERPYFTMELLYNPITLTDIVDHRDRGALSMTWPRLRHWADSARLIKDVLLPVMDGIAVSNVDYRMQHRDLKPDNILIDVRTRRAYVIDFGICRSLDDETQDGKIVGTPRFLSPEQARGTTDERTDVWGLGALLFYVVSGEPPIQRSSPFTRREVRERIEALTKAEEAARAADRVERAEALAARRAQFEAPEFRALEDLYIDAREGRHMPLPSDTAPALAAIIRKAMSPQPADRYVSGRELVEDLRAWLAGDSVKALTERDSRKATMRQWKLRLRKHLITGVAVTAGLILGLVLGAAVFTEEPTAPDYRLADVQLELDQIETRLDRLARQDGTRRSPRIQHDLWAELHGRLTSLGQRVGTAAESEELIARVRALDTRIPRHTLVVEGAADRRLLVFDLLAHDARERLRRNRGRALEEGRITLTPGLYLLAANGSPRISRFVAVPFTVDAGAPVITLTYPEAPANVPDGMTWLDAQGEVTPLLVSAPVTCEQYAAFLDDLPADERLAAVPPTGFHQGDPADQSRWLARVDAQNKPVVGVRPQDAAAFAAWRARDFGVALRLPTRDEYRRMLGADLFEAATREATVPGLVYPAPRHGMRGPYGLPHLYSAPAELLQDTDGSWYLGGSTSRDAEHSLPVPARLADGPRLEQDAAAPAPGAGFRLVLAP